MPFSRICDLVRKESQLGIFLFNEGFETKLQEIRLPNASLSPITNVGKKSYIIQSIGNSVNEVCVLFEYCIVENVINIDVLLAIIKIYSNKRYHHGTDTHINKLAIYQKRIVWFLDTINYLPRGNFWCLEFSILVLHDFQ